MSIYVFLFPAVILYAIAETWLTRRMFRQELRRAAQLQGEICVITEEADPRTTSSDRRGFTVSVIVKEPGGRPVYSGLLAYVEEGDTCKIPWPPVVSS